MHVPHRRSPFGLLAGLFLCAVVSGCVDGAAFPGDAADLGDATGDVVGTSDLAPTGEDTATLASSDPLAATHTLGDVERVLSFPGEARALAPGRAGALPELAPTAHLSAVAERLGPEPPAPVPTSLPAHDPALRPAKAPDFAAGVDYLSSLGVTVTVQELASMLVWELDPSSPELVESVLDFDARILLTLVQAQHVLDAVARR